MDVKNKYSAGILAATLGVIGLHWFYLGKRFLGAIHIAILIITLLFVQDLEILFDIFLLVCFFYGVRFFLISDEKFSEKYKVSTTKQKNKNKYLTGWLALILGFLGLHRFYLEGEKNRRIGFIYLTLFVVLFSLGAIITNSKDSLLIFFFIPFIIIWLEALYFLFCSKKSFNDKYNQESLTMPEDKNQLLAGLLAIKFGNIGVHYLYTGYIKKAFIYIILTTISVGIILIYLVGVFISIVLQYVSFVKSSPDLAPIIIFANDAFEILDAYIRPSHFYYFIKTSSMDVATSLYSNPFLLIGLILVIVSVLILLALRVLSFISGYKILKMSEESFIENYIKNK